MKQGQTVRARRNWGKCSDLKSGESCVIVGGETSIHGVTPWADAKVSSGAGMAAGRISEGLQHLIDPHLCRPSVVD